MGHNDFFNYTLFTFTHAQKLNSLSRCHMKNICSRSLNIQTYYSS